MNVRRRPVLLTVASIAFAYVVSFGCTFELLGDLVRSEAGQWLGPPKRFNVDVADIGKLLSTTVGKCLFIAFAGRLVSSRCGAWVFPSRSDCSGLKEQRPEVNLDIVEQKNHAAPKKP